MASLDRDAPSTAGALFGLVYFSTWFMGAAVVCVGALTIAPVLFSQPWIAGTSLGLLALVAVAVAAWQIVALVALATDAKDPELVAVLTATPAAVVLLIGVFGAWTAFGWLQGFVHGPGAADMHWLVSDGSWLDARISDTGVHVGINLTEGGERARQFLEAMKLYVWEAANTVPLLDIPDTLGWKRPSAFSGTIVGALVLAFRLIVLIVIVRVAVRGYEWARATHFQRRPLMPPVAWVSAPPRDSDLADDDPVMRAARKALRASLVVVVLVVIAAATALATHLVARVLPPGVTLPLMLLLAAGALAWVIAEGFQAVPDRWLLRPVAVVAARVAVLIAAFEMFAAASVILLGAHILSISAPVGPDRMAASEAFYLWHVVNAVPGLEIPKTLGWRLHGQLEGVTSALMLLAFKAVVALPPLAAAAAALRGGRQEPART